MKKRPEFSNRSNGIPLSCSQISMCLKKIGFTPIKIGNNIWLVTKEGELIKVADRDQFFGEITEKSIVNWHHGTPSKAEYFEYIRSNSNKYSTISQINHSPEIPSVYYQFESPTPIDGNHLDNLISQFNPVSDIDGALIKALILTLFWGGPPGQKPLFVVTSNPTVNDQTGGVGTGKTTLVQLISRLVGGYISWRPHGDFDRAVSDLFSEDAQGKSLILMDNIKSHRFGNENLECLITASRITGHKLYFGHAEIPNHFTYVATVNGASFTRDLASRSVVIHLNRPEMVSNWLTRITRYLDQNKDAIIANIFHLLESPKMNVPHQTRWDPWCQGVLGAFSNHRDIVRAIQTRTGEINNDSDESQNLFDHIAALLENRMGNIQSQRFHIHSLQIGHWARPFLRGTSVNSATHHCRSYLGHLLPQGRSSSRGRFFIFTGPNCPANAQPVWVPYVPPNS